MPRPCSPNWKEADARQRATMNKTHITLAILAALALTGCSGSSASPTYEDGAPVGQPAQVGLFEFQHPEYGSGAELTVRIPDDLVKAAGSDADGLLVTSASASARTLDSSRYCAVDLTFDYAKGGADVLTRPAVTKQDFEKGNADAQVALDADLVSEFGSLEAAEQQLGEGYGEYRDEMLMVNGFVAGEFKETPALENLAKRLVTTSTVMPVGDLDEGAPSSGVYMSEDLATMTVVQNCAMAPSDDSDTTTIKFPVEANGKVQTFASAEITVMKNGSLTIVDSKVDGYIRDSNGDWIGG